MASEDDPFWAAMNRTFPVAAARTTDYTGTPENIPNEDDFLDGLFDEEQPQAAENPQYYGDLMPVTAVNDALGRKRVAADELTDYTKRVKTTTAQPGPGKPSSASNQRLLEMLRSGERSRSKSTPITKVKSQQKRTPQPQAPKAQLTQEELRSALQREVEEYVRMAEDDYDAKKQKLYKKDLPRILAAASAQNRDPNLAKSEFLAKIQRDITRHRAKTEKKKLAVQAALLEVLTDTKELFESGTDLKAAEKSYAFLQQFFASDNKYVKEILATDPVQRAKLAVDQSSVGSLLPM